jgi:hypothetical protein
MFDEVKLNEGFLRCITNRQIQTGSKQSGSKSIQNLQRKKLT